MMNKDGNYRLNVSFDGLVTDFGWVSLNKKREAICGDYFDIMENDSDHVLVLSDGLGSGVKANILSTLTARMLSHMIIKKLPIYDAVAAVADTLPVCSVRIWPIPPLPCWISGDGRRCSTSSTTRTRS